ncbi:hypothetical protein AcW1_000605 [Taiwanofungus camphoratus]|nr:hypothetical protein AcW2_000900 [Antrodia cinnamomea]KAI0936339.1 hypothetical protein AcV5_004504 [Antrodia cinnamomea]KAI0963562.1 hypothetical protein AcW1_000605 [Antrodia cinnamomea]
MHSIIRAIIVAINLAVFSVLVSGPFCSVPALGFPLPVPMPLRVAYAEFAQRSSDLGPRLSHALAEQVKHNGTDHETKLTPPTYHKRDITSILDNIGLLNSYYTQINQNAHTINSLASQSASGQGGSIDFNQQTVSAVSAFHTNLVDFQGVLAQLAADKGLANYDKDNTLETLLKNTINAVKDLLSNVDELIGGIPVLGPLLGPSEYWLISLWLTDFIRVIFLLVGQLYTTSSASWMKLWTQLRI